MESPPDLYCREFTDVTFLPCIRDLKGRTGYTFGAHGPDGVSYEAFRHQWCEFRVGSPLPANLPGPVIYGGLLMNHFGHFLLEALSRLWFIRRRPDLPVLWHWIDLPVPHTVWKGWIEELWRLLGLAAGRHLVMRQPVRCSQVLLPDSGLLPPDQLHPDQVAALRCVPTPETTHGTHVWLSRSRLPAQFGRVEGEAELEATLKARGWTIVQPELSPAAVTAGLFATADIVGGFAGSAFHAALLAQAPRALLLVVERASVPRGYCDLTHRACGVPVRYLVADLAPLGPMNGWTTFRLGNPEDLAARICADSSS